MFGTREGQNFGRHKQRLAPIYPKWKGIPRIGFLSSAPTRMSQKIDRREPKERYRRLRQPSVPIAIPTRFSSVGIERGTSSHRNWKAVARPERSVSLGPSTIFNGGIPCSKFSPDQYKPFSVPMSPLLFDPCSCSILSSSDILPKYAFARGANNDKIFVHLERFVASHEFF